MFNDKILNLPDKVEKITINSIDYDEDLVNLPLSLRELIVQIDYNGRVEIPEGCVIEYKQNW